MRCSYNYESARTCAYVYQCSKGFTSRIPSGLTVCVCTLRFDVILDNVGGETEQWVIGMLKPWSGAKYITLVTPLLHNTDSMGLLDGMFHAGFTLHSKAIQVNMSKTNFQH